MESKIKFVKEYFLTVMLVWEPGGAGAHGS